MNDLALLYLWVKLDDIKAFLSNDLGITMFLAVVALIFLSMYTGVRKDKDGNNYPFSGLFSDDKDVVEDCKKKTSLSIKIVIASLILQILFNFITAALPSTKQLAVIYTLHVGVNSETFKSLRSLDADMAAALRAKAKEWLDTSISPAKAKK